MLHDPAGAQADTSSLRVCVSGGSALPVEIMRRFERAFGCMILEGYGLTETSPVASFNHPGRVRKPGSIGTPVEGVEMRVVDAAAGVGGAGLLAGEIGEILIRGHNVMKGYWRNPDATAVTIIDGWLRTGDLARVDQDGYFYLVDRKKDLIIRGGLKVYPREIEEVLYEHPAVAEAAVTGIPDADLGQEVGAALTLKPTATVTPEELRAGPGSTLQVPAPRLGRARPAQGPDRQDPPPRGTPTAGPPVTATTGGPAAIPADAHVTNGT